MGIEEKPPPPVAPARLASEPDIGRQRGKVGAPLEEVRSRLYALGRHLETSLDAHALPLVSEARRVLHDQTCRIAVIGQIKAGKSSFINALTQRSDLLPTDINPWTAVVTSLHFRSDRPPPQHAAVFHMFTREEWQRLAEGGGRLRELTERLVPGFEPDLLRAQIEVMRQRVERRLGAQLEPLLGQSHRFDSITPELLDTYVSAGTYLDDARDGNRQQYSDITRAADLYFSGGPFAYPVTLVDTPGTNDPFLVRDEITRRSLENSDIYIFVISALQPLSATDIALLRILNGLHKDRILVYVNRIDQLPNPLIDAQAVKVSVKTRLDREFPALDIPVITGSAWWGGLALVATGRDISRMLPQSSIACLRAFGLPDNLEVAPGQALPPELRGRLAAALHAGSGIPAICNGIDGLLHSGSAAVMLRQLATCFHELARSTEVSVKMEVQSVMSLAKTQRVETRMINDRIRQERAALANLDGPIGQIQHSFALIERQLRDIVATDVGNLAGDLRTIVEQFTAEECAAMMVSIRRRDHNGEWRTDLKPLREDLESHYVAAYRATEARLIEIERVLYPQLKTIVDAIVPGSGIAVSENYAVHANPYPSVAPLTEAAVLELDLPWWKSWFAARPDPGERAAQLKQILHEDFMPMTQQLCELANRELSARVSRTLQQAHVVSAGMLSAIQSRKAQVLADYEDLVNRQGGAGADQIDAERQEQINRSSARLATASQLVVELAKVVAMCQFILDAELRAP